MEMIKDTIVEAIGNTPLIRLDRFTKARGLKGAIFAKLDYLSPGFSKKDRAALGAIEHAEKSGELSPGQTVIELTSGNMGTGLAIVCGLKDYPFIAVMSKGNSEERARMMRALGAEVVMVDQMPDSTPGQVSGKDLELVDIEAKKIALETKGVRVDQFSRQGACMAHYETTGPEVWHQSSGTIDGFCDFLGTGGTFAGVTKYLKEKNPLAQCYVVEPTGAAVISGCELRDENHPIQGGGYAIPSPIFLEGISIDGYLEVTGDEAKETTRALAIEEGVFAGFSSGANVAAAAKLLQGPMIGKNIAVVICDSGLKYLSTDLYG